MADFAKWMPSLRPPGAGDKVFKDECCYTFDTPLSPGGLFISLHTFRVR